MIRVRFTRDFDWKAFDPYCNCKKITAFKAGWSGLIHNDPANAALSEGKAEMIETVPSKPIKVRRKNG